MCQYTHTRPNKAPASKTRSDPMYTHTHAHTSHIINSKSSLQTMCGVLGRAAPASERVLCSLVFYFRLNRHDSGCDGDGDGDYTLRDFFPSPLPSGTRIHTYLFTCARACMLTFMQKMHTIYQSSTDSGGGFLLAGVCACELHVISSVCVCVCYGKTKRQ